MTVEEKCADAKAAYDRIVAALNNQEPYQDIDLGKLLDYAFDSEKKVWDRCSYYFNLAGRLPIVQEKLLEIMHKGTARERWLITIHVFPDHSGADFCREIIELALKDQSIKVSRYGVMRASSFCFREYIGLIKNIINSEKNMEYKKELTDYCRYLEEDFILEKLEDQKYRLRYHHGFLVFETEIEDHKKLRDYVLEHFSDRIYAGYWAKS